MESIQTVRPVRPAAGYLGGKRNLAKRLCSLIDGLDHDGYAEPFVGMGGIFLRRTTQPRVEAINDVNGEVVNLFRILQEHYPYFIDMLRWRIASRNEFERLKGIDPERLTDLQRAARFLYLQRLAFGGKVTGQNFGVDKSQGARFNITKLEPLLGDIHERLAGVTIEQLSFDRFVGRWDRPGMLFYCDPPYFGCENDYGADVFERGDFEKLAGLARNGRGKMIISINDTPEVRTIFSGLRMLEVQTTYTISTATTGGKRVGELVIANFDLASEQRLPPG